MRTAELLTAVGRGLLKLASPPPLALRRFADPDDSAAIKGATSSCSEPRADRCAGLARGSDWDEELFPDEQGPSATRLDFADRADIPSAHKSNSAKALRFDDIDSVKVTFEDPTPSPGQRPSQYLRYFGRDVAEQEAARRREAAEDEERELRDRMYVKPAKFEDAMIPILDMRRASCPSPGCS